MWRAEMAFARDPWRLSQHRDVLREAANNIDKNSWEGYRHSRRVEVPISNRDVARPIPSNFRQHMLTRIREELNSCVQNGET